MKSIDSELATVLKKTPLHDLHTESGARMVPFAGYEMPVQYHVGLNHEHVHTRTQAGLFDISHMGQFRLVGDRPLKALEKLVPSSLSNLAVNKQRYTVFTNETGGIIDDLIVTNRDNHVFIVVNAACKSEDKSHMQQTLGANYQLQELSEHGLLALQGPQAALVMQRFCPEANTLSFMTAGVFIINTVECFISRSGYTGEDGFEISIPVDELENIARWFLTQDEVELIGLGARDSLRLEAGLCLYGHDIDTRTSPLEANIGWTISKSRLDDNESSSFPGIDRIKEEWQQGINRLRVGLRSNGKIPLREGMKVLNDKNDVVGELTSGGVSPTLAVPVAMGYIEIKHAKIGTELIIEIRNKTQAVQVVPLPFVQHRYHKI